jgi:hypothetical protein
MKTSISKRSAERESPYTHHTVEGAISHLERMLSVDAAKSLFSRTYWRARVQQVSATHGLTPLQQARLVKLMKSLPAPDRGEDPS